MTQQSNGTTSIDLSALDDLCETPDTEQPSPNKQTETDLCAIDESIETSKTETYRPDPIHFEHLEALLFDRIEALLNEQRIEVHRFNNDNDPKLDVGCTINQGDRITLDGHQWIAFKADDHFVKYETKLVPGHHYIVQSQVRYVGKTASIVARLPNEIVHIYNYKFDCFVQEVTPRFDWYLVKCEGMAIFASQRGAR